MEKRNRKTTEDTADIDRGLLPGLHHVNWRDGGESKDKTRYGHNGKIKQNEKKRLHKLTI